MKIELTVNYFVKHEWNSKLENLHAFKADFSVTLIVSKEKDVEMNFLKIRK